MSGRRICRPGQSHTKAPVETDADPREYGDYPGVSTGTTPADGRPSAPDGVDSSDRTTWPQLFGMSPTSFRATPLRSAYYGSQPSTWWLDTLRCCVVCLCSVRCTVDLRHVARGTRARSGGRTPLLHQLHELPMRVGADTNIAHLRTQAQRGIASRVVPGSRRNWLYVPFAPRVRHHTSHVPCDRHHGGSQVPEASGKGGGQHTWNP